MLGVETWLPGVEHRIAASAIIAIVAILCGIGVRRARRALKRHINPVTVDVVSSTATVTVLIAAAVLIAEVWSQTGVLVEQLGFLRFDERAPEVAITVVIVIAIQVFSGISRRLLDDLTHESHALTDHQREIGIRITHLSLWGVGMVVILGVWDVDLTGLLVGAGFIGIVLGLASRKTIGSLMAGLVLMFSRPFEVGEWIVVGEKEGIVTDITLMSTRLRAFNGEHVVVPNDVITGEIVTNRSREGRLRTQVEVGIDYEDDIGRATELAQSVALEIAAEQDQTGESPEPSVLVKSLDDSAVVMAVRVWVDTPSSGEITQLRHELLSRIKTAFTSAGITIPFPQRELSSRDDMDGPCPVGDDVGVE